MPVDPSFAAAFIDESTGGDYSPHRILGVKLRRFSLWHVLLLRTIESPMLFGGAVTFFSLRTAIGICGLKFGDSVVRRPMLVPALLMLKAIIQAVFTRKKDKNARNPYQRALAGVAEKFSKYCDDYTQEPIYSVVPRKGVVSEARGRAPEELEISCEVIAWSGWDEDAVWNMPIGRLRWYVMMARRLAGVDIDPLSEEELEYQKNLPPEFKHTNGTR